jgi:hypothetical protein
MVWEPLPFPVIDSGGFIVLRVRADGARLALDAAEYEVEFNTATSTARVRTLTPWPADDRLLIRRRTSRIQNARIVSNQPLPSRDLERQLDRQTLVGQEIEAAIADTTARALLAPEGQALAPIVGARPGKVLGFGADPAVPIMLNPGGADTALREDLADSFLGGLLVAWRANGLAAVARSVVARLRGLPAEPEDYGAVGDGVTDDLMPIQAAVNANRRVDFRTTSYFVSAPVKILSGRVLSGAGKSAWEPYTGDSAPGEHLTRIVVDGTDAFDARQTNCVTVRGFGFHAAPAMQSSYRAEPGYQPGSGGIAITGSLSFQAYDISFFGLEYGVHSHLYSASLPGGETVSGVETDEALASLNTTQMPSIRDWQASDCKVVFAFGHGGSALYTARDIVIGQEVVALHCGSIITAHRCDGLRVENVRLYQCTGHTIFARGSVFLSIIGATVFENARDAIVLQECENIVVAGLTTARTGLYAAPIGGTPEDPVFEQYSAIRLDRCITTFVGGVIEKPMGRLIDMDQCTTTVLNLACDTPFWQTGNATNLSGAIEIRNSEGTTVNASIGGANHWVSVWADPESARTIAGSLTGNSSGGVVRAVKLQQQGGYTYRVAAAQEVVAGGVWPFDTLRMFVPENKRLVTRSVEITIDGFALRANGLTWSAETLAEPGGGSIAFDDKPLAEASETGRYVEIPLSIVNLSGATLIAPVGAEIRLSTALVEAL